MVNRVIYLSKISIHLSMYDSVFFNEVKLVKEEIEIVFFLIENIYGLDIVYLNI